MDFSKLQIVALVVLTTILTDKFLINHNLPPQVQIPPLVPTPSLSLPTTVTSNTAPSGVSQNELMLKEIQNLRKDMLSAVNNLQVKSGNADIASSLSSSLIGGMVKISSPQWRRVDVFEKPVSSSKIISSIVFDSIYFYTNKSDGWYQLNLDGGQNGYVQASFLKEFP